LTNRGENLAKITSPMNLADQCCEICMDDFVKQIVEFKDVTVPEKFVLRRLGYPPKMTEIPQSIKKLIDYEYRRSADLIRSVCSYSILRVNSITKDKVILGDSDIEIKSSNIAKLLADSEYAVIFMTTIGHSLEETVVKLSEEGEITSSLILDAIGSETVDYAADILHRKDIASIAEKRGFSITPRFSPGYGDWDLSAQKDVLRVCGGEEIGISVSETFMMSPQKSVSAIFGLVRG